MKSALFVFVFAILASLLPGQVKRLPGACDSDGLLLLVSEAAIGGKFTTYVRSDHNYPKNRIVVAWGTATTEVPWMKPGCHLRVMPLGIWDQTPPVFISERLIITHVPNNADLIGLPIYVQAAMDGGLMGFDMSDGYEVKIEVPN